MAHSNKQQPDFSHNPDPQNRQKTEALSRDIEDLDNALKTDFDQKLGEIADMLARFKALIVAPAKAAANEDNNTKPNSVAPANPAADTEELATVTPLFSSATVDNELENNAVQESAKELPTPDSGNNDSNNTNELADSAPIAATTTQSRYAPEPARFEIGLYKLNSQLYRFRLELDQEMEFREEPLHLHFNQESELSMMFQKLSDTTSEKNSGS